MGNTLKWLATVLGSWFFQMAEWVGSEELARLRRELERLEGLAETDKLTGLLNPHGEQRVVEEMMAILKRANVSVNMSLIVFDLDRFKQVNDSLGHAVGDQVLQVVANTMRQVFRKTDQLARLSRLGGDEFCVVCLNANPRQAAMAAERLRTSLRNNPELNFGQDIGQVTASIGVAAIDTSQPDVSTAYHAAKHSADQAMYQAKASGRDAVFFA